MINTPALLTDRSRVVENYKRLSQALPGFRICYAIKSNPHSELIDALYEAGSHFETASTGEIHYLLEHGVSPSEIILSNPIKAPEAIAEAIELGVNTMSFDCLEEASKFLPHRHEARLIFRIQVPNIGSMWPLTGKFGSALSMWEGVFHYMAENSLPLAGITFHVGSQCESLEAWDAALERCYQAIELAHSFGLHPEIVNIGGGFPIAMGRPVPEVEQIGSLIASHLQRWREHGFQPAELIAEPGRYLSGSAGTLVTRIIGVAQREDRKWVYLDCGVFSGMMETIDGITYPLLSTGSGALERVLLCGPSCDSVDKMFEVDLPAPKVGDLLYLSSAGAYTTVYASAFNGFRPLEVVMTDTIAPADLMACAAR